MRRQEGDEGKGQRQRWVARGPSQRSGHHAGPHPLHTDEDGSHRQTNNILRSSEPLLPFSGSITGEHAVLEATDGDAGGVDEERELEEEGHYGLDDRPEFDGGLDPDAVEEGWDAGGEWGEG